MADRSGYIGRNPGDSSVIVARQYSLQQEFKPTLHLPLDTLLVIWTHI